MQYKPTGSASKLYACEIASKRAADHWSPTRRATLFAHCPTHTDRRPSLSVRDSDGRVLVRCFAGCRQADVMAALQRLGLLSGRSDPRRTRNGVCTASQARTAAMDARPVEAVA